MCVPLRSGPYVDVDMRSGEMDGYDAVFLSPHKFIGGPGTPGILLMNQALYRLAGQPPSTCGGGTVAYVNGFSEEVREACINFLLAHACFLKYLKNEHITFLIWYILRTNVMKFQHFVL